LPAIDLAHVDLAGSHQRPEQHGGGVVTASLLERLSQALARVVPHLRACGVFVLGAGFVPADQLPEVPTGSGGMSGGADGGAPTGKEERPSPPLGNVRFRISLVFKQTAEMSHQRQDVGD